MMKKLLKKQMMYAAMGLLGLCGAQNAAAQWTPVDTAGFAINGNSWTHLFADAQDSLYVSFAGQGKVMKYNGTHWMDVGGAISTGGATDCWSAKAPNGNLYYSFAESGNSNKAAVSVYNGTAWTSLGTGISAGAATYTNIAVTAAGVPWLSYIDGSTSPSSLYVRRYNAGNWDVAGGVPLTTNGAGYSSMALGINDTVYIAYQDAAASQNVTVQKFDGTNWLPVGPSFCAQPFGGAFSLSLAIDHNGLPYVSYMNPYAMGSKVCVSKYDGANWVTVGAASFTGAGAFFTSLAIDKNNVPYVSFQDGANSAKVGVMKFDGTSWVVVGSTPNVSVGAGIFTSIAIDANNNPFVAYMETNGGTTVMKYPVCTAPSAAVIAANDTTICKGTSVALTATGTLNDATKWYWYSGSCSGTLADSGATINRTPGDTTTYYVHGGGGCVLYSACRQFTVYVDSMAKPAITNNSGTVNTAATATSYQWYKGGVAVPGATAQSYATTASGWYKLTVTNANGCTATSDSLFIIPAGIASLYTTTGISIYPTVFNDRVNIDLSNVRFDRAATALVIKDNIGRTVYEQKGLAAQNSLPLSSLTPGLYFANIITPQNRYTVKLVKE